MNKQQAIDSVKVWFPQWLHERERLDKLDAWLRGEQDLPPSPMRRATSEHRMLRELSRTPHMALIVTALAQTLVVDGYRSPSKPTTEEDDPEQGPPSPWDIFLANGLDSKQNPIHRGALGLGYAFASILPGTSPITGGPMAAIQGKSARDMFAAWANPAEDDWPILAIEVRQQPSKDFAVKLYEQGNLHMLATDSSGTKVEWLDVSVHGQDFCPVARCANQLDLDGRTPSEIEPLLPVARRLDKDVYDRLLAQHFNSWKVRTLTGLAEPDPPDGLSGDDLQQWLKAWSDATKIRLAQEDILVATDPEAKFGTLDATALDGFVKAHDSDLESLAAASQMARQNFGQMINMPAEAFAAAETMQQRRSGERKRSMTKFWNQTLRAAAGMSGNAEAATDYQAHVTWADTESRSLTQAAAALAQLATGLGIPPQGLWERIPGVTDTDIATWTALLAKQGTLSNLQAQLDKLVGGNNDQPPPPNQPPAPPAVG